MIEIKHLDIKFDKQIIFKNVNFKTCPGKITGIIGKSGCGKTTFLKALIYQYKNQILSIDKQVITEKNKEDYLLHCVSYIDQFGTFFENMKIREHFEFISQLRKQEFDQDKMLEMLHLVGLDNIDLSYFPSSLSIGQRKRFLIALAMYKDASIVIIDEPTASLNQENKEIILNLLQKLKKDNKYIIITTHDDFLIEHLDIVYEIENKQLYCHQEIKEVQKNLKIENTKVDFTSSNDSTNITGISYNQVTDQYVVSYKSNKSYIFDNEYKLVATLNKNTTHSTLEYQSTTSNSNYIYQTFGTDGTYATTINVFDWNGKFITSLDINTKDATNKLGNSDSGSVQCVFEFNEKIYLLVLQWNDSKGGFLYQLNMDQSILPE